MILDIEDVISSKFPQCSFSHFGSYAMDLSIFLSDVDLSVDNIMVQQQVQQQQPREEEDTIQDALLYHDTIDDGEVIINKEIGKTIKDNDIINKKIVFLEDEHGNVVLDETIVQPSIVMKRDSIMINAHEDEEIYWKIDRSTSEILHIENDDIIETSNRKDNVHNKRIHLDDCYDDDNSDTDSSDNIISLEENKSIEQFLKENIDHEHINLVGNSNKDNAGEDVIDEQQHKEEEEDADNNNDDSMEEGEVKEQTVHSHSQKHSLSHSEKQVAVRGKEGHKSKNVLYSDSDYGDGGGGDSYNVNMDNQYINKINPAKRLRFSLDTTSYYSKEYQDSDDNDSNNDNSHNASDHSLNEDIDIIFIDKDLNYQKADDFESNHHNDFVVTNKINNSITNTTNKINTSSTKTNLINRNSNNIKTKQIDMNANKQAIEESNRVQKLQILQKIYSLIAVS